MTLLKETEAIATVTFGQVYCPICTHTVEAQIVTTRKKQFVKPGQRCPRCGSLLDAAHVLGHDRAA